MKNGVKKENAEKVWKFSTKTRKNRANRQDLPDFGAADRT